MSYVPERRIEGQLNEEGQKRTYPGPQAGVAAFINSNPDITITKEEDSCLKILMNSFESRWTSIQ